jgi:hydroxyethylthiazole kinase-like sugar kinase family protein
MKTTEVGAKALSRRSVLAATGCMIGASAAVAMAATEASAQAKVLQAVVAYQDSPKGAQQCDNCESFQPPNACKTVTGEVSPEGWCKIWRRKPS